MSSGTTPIPNGIIAINETKILTFGEELIGIDFSTEEDSSDYTVKKNIADIVNILNTYIKEVSQRVYPLWDFLLPRRTLLKFP